MKRPFFASLIAIVGIALFSLMMIGISDAEIDIRSALVALTFDEGEGEISFDLSRKRNHGTLMRGVTWGEGKFGGGAVFDGEEGYVEVRNFGNAWEFGEADFTLAAYVLMNGKGKEKIYGIMGYTTPNAAAWDGWLLLLRHCCAGEQLFFHHCIGCGGGGGGGTDWGPQIPGRYKYKEWHHYAMSRNGNKMKMFYDGKEIGEKDWDSVINAIRADGEPLNIGSTGQPGDEYYLNGMMDDVAVFNFALSEEDLQQLVMEGLADALAVSPSGKLATTWAHIKKRK